VKIIEVPEFQEDGSVKVVHMLSEREAQYLLQFAVNFLLSTGQNVVQQTHNPAQQELPLQ
jgi:hypothetical protein